MSQNKSQSGNDESVDPLMEMFFKQAKRQFGSAMNRRKRYAVS